MELRAYARAKSTLENAEHEDDVKPTPMIDMVYDVELELFRRRKAAFEQDD